MEVFLIYTLGERIRTLRKQQKLTLEALAGDHLTKGMLSLIENNKANPSMESLSYIAERLGVEVSELMEEVSSHELREILEKAEKLYHTDFDKLTDEYEQIIALIAPYADKLNDGYEAGRLLEIYSSILIIKQQDGWQPYFDKAAHIYDQLNLIPRLAAIGNDRSYAKFVEHDYEGALAVLLEERKNIESRNVFIDPMTRLDFDYMEAVLYFAVGNADEAIRVMNSGIEFSKKHKVFYRIDHLYRLALFHATMHGDEEARQYYTHKIKLYGEFTDDEEILSFARFAEIHYLNSYTKEYQKALECIDKLFDPSALPAQENAYFHLERGKALYGLGRYEEALSHLENVTISEMMHHPFDLSIYYVKDAYAGLCKFALGYRDQALAAIDTAVAHIEPMPPTPYKDFIMDTLELIQTTS